MKNIIISKKKNTSIRIDKFLVREFFSLGMTRGEIIRNVKKGNVLVNSKKAKPSYKLKADDKITFPSPPPSLEGRGGLVLNSNLKIKIIYQDKNIIVVDKPAGIQVHPDHNEKKNTLVNWLIYKFPEIREVIDVPSYIRSIDGVHTADPRLRSGIVHRLDKDTSGVMAVARNMKAFQELKKLFKEHQVEKKYLALVYGILKNKEGVIEKPIARAATYRKQVIAGRKTKTKIREAVTEYKVLKEFNNFSLLEVMPKTGRMHQIRIHLFSINHPVIGDKLYKLKNIKLIQAQRQMLHAEQIKFKLFGKNYSFSSPIPNDFQKTQKSLQK